MLRGFDQFMNLVLDNTVEINGADRNEIGMVVRTLRHGEFCLCDDASAQELLTILLFSVFKILLFLIIYLLVSSACVGTKSALILLLGLGCFILNDFHS